MNRSLTSRLASREVLLLILTLAAAAWSAQLSPYYLDLGQILHSTRHFVFAGLLALGLAIIVILGEIDISLASILAVGAVLFSKFSAYDVSIFIAVPVVIVACALLGSFNGFLVARLGLPSLAVTLGTMGAFRGLAFIIGSETGYTSFSESYTWIGSMKLWGILPVSFVVFLLCALGLGFLMHRTVFGRRCYSVGNNKEASWIAGIDVPRLKIMAFAIAGALAGVASLVWVGQYGSARGDNADGAILFVVTAVVLGGIDINGGRGRIVGVILALLLLGTIRNGMGLANIAGPSQTVVLGTLLVLGVLRPAIANAIALGHRLMAPRTAARITK